MQKCLLADVYHCVDFHCAQGCVTVSRLPVMAPRVPLEQDYCSELVAVACRQCSLAGSADGCAPCFVSMLTVGRWSCYLLVKSSPVLMTFCAVEIFFIHIPALPVLFMFQRQSDE